MRRATNLFVTMCCLLLVLSSCAVMPAENADKVITDQTTEPVVEPTKPQDTITTEKYTLFWEDGKSYMEHHPGKENESSEDSALRIAHYPTFSSIREMREKLIAGDLAPEEIAELMRYAPKDTNIVEICNINKLYEAIYPDDVMLEQIILNGTGYLFELGNGYIRCHSKDDYLQAFDRKYNGTNLSDSINILSVEKVAERNAEVMRYNTLGTEVTRVRYTNETEKGTQYVLEIYRDNTLRVYIFGENNGAYYSAFIRDLEERPSLEWISSFGLREYVETEVS